MADKSLDFKIRLTAEDRAAASLKAAAAAIKEVEAAQRSANSAAQAWQTLGARSGEAIRADMEKVKAALASIRGSGAPIDEMGRATQAASQRLRELGRELALVEKPITGIERLFSKLKFRSFHQATSRSTAAISGFAGGLPEGGQSRPKPSPSSVMASARRTSAKANSVVRCAA